MTRRGALYGAVVSVLLLVLVAVTLLDPLDSSRDSSRDATGRQGPAPAEAPAREGAEVRPEDHGAVGDGTVDDTDALQRALDSLSPNDVLVLSEGRTYRHDEVLRVRVPWSGITGPGALLAGEEERSALRLEADGVRLTGVVLAVRETTKRWTGSDQHRLVLDGRSGMVVRDVEVTGSAGAGVYVHGASDFLLEDVTVSDSRADGIHMTGGSEDGVVRRPTVNRSGDDGVAVVSYGDDPGPTRRITVEDAAVNTTTWGRGITVVGGEDVVYRRARVQDTSASGIYVATEGDPWFTMSAKRIRFEQVEVLQANRNEDVDHGAVLVSGAHEGTVVEDVDIEDVRIEGTRVGATRQVGLLESNGSVDSIRFTDVTVEGGGRVFQADADPETYVASGWVVAGRPVEDPAAL